MKELDVDDLLKNFIITESPLKVPFTKYKQYSYVTEMYKSGYGQVGKEGYLILWEKDVLEKRNDDYKVTQFVDDVFLIGSDGGENAFGVNSNREFVVMPFIGMNNKSVVILSTTFDGFLRRIANCEF